MNDDNISDAFKEAAMAVYETLEPERQDRTRRIAHMATTYVGTARDKLLDHAFDAIVENSAAEAFGKASKQRVLFVIGESGSGKTTAVEKHLAKRPQFKPRVRSDGTLVHPMIWMEAPKPLTRKGLAKAGLKALGHEVTNRSLTETELFDLWKTQICAQGVLFLAIDEMQHVIRGPSAKEVQDVADIVKSLVQIPGWPLHLILSGVPALGRFLEQEGETERQLKERSIIVEFQPMTYPDDVKVMIKVIQRIVTVDAELEADGLKEKEFIHRLLHAASGAFGSMIQITRKACENAMRSNRDVVSIKDFEVAYALASGCRAAQNIFTATNWNQLMPDRSLSEMLRTVSSAQETPPKKTRRK